MDGIVKAIKREMYDNMMIYTGNWKCQNNP